MSDDEVLTIRAVVPRLGGREKAIYAMARLAELSGFHVRGPWRSPHTAVDVWGNAQVWHAGVRSAERTGDE